MVESKYTKVHVNNEVELCEVYERDIKEKIEKAFVKHNISFFIKWKRERTDRKENGKYIIFVNRFNRQKAEAVIHELLEDVNDNISFSDARTEKGFRLKKLLHLREVRPSAIFSKM